MSGPGPLVMTVDERSRAFAEDVAPAREEAEGLALHATAEMRRLATPWTVALARAGLLQGVELGPGILLDPACGSGTQLAALCHVLGRPGLGIELAGAVAPMAAVNLENAAAWSEGTWGAASRVVWGDGIASAVVREAHAASLGATPPIALLHVDPARPADAQRHTLEEMQPALDLLLEAWAPHLGQTPALILDLSPRLSDAQRVEVEGIVDSLWPGIERTWQWMTQGRGRIDRLSLWVGGVAIEADARLLRLDRHGGLTAITGASRPSAGDASPEAGQHLSIVDPSLIASGLAEAWCEGVGGGDWAVLKGRRPILLSEAAPQADEMHAGFLAASGEIVHLAPAVDLDEIEEWVEAALAHDLSSLQLRCTLDPEMQPRMQSALDRALRKAEATGARGFVVDIDGTHLICRMED